MYCRKPSELAQGESHALVICALVSPEARAGVSGSITTLAPLFSPPLTCRNESCGAQCCRARQGKNATLWCKESDSKLLGALRGTRSWELAVRAPHKISPGLQMAPCHTLDTPDL
ncbi:hypothetical protein AMECASPLE_026484 [Ameca splendens]|uniref:Uncharacterized protein n=1 Tax=Ameca splendens TaxID=208324 RepID=A0ABV0Y4X9_9TELE